MSSDKRAILLLLAYSLGVIALAVGFLFATAEDAHGLMPVDAVAVPVQEDARDASKEQQERKQHRAEQGKDPLAVALAYPDRVARASGNRK